MFEVYGPGGTKIGVQICRDSPLPPPINSYMVFFHPGTDSVSIPFQSCRRHLMEDQPAIHKSHR